MRRKTANSEALPASFPTGKRGRPCERKAREWGKFEIGKRPKSFLKIYSLLFKD
jgi:hypothetical protein